MEEVINSIQEEHESRAVNDEDRRVQVALSFTKPYYPFSQCDCGRQNPSLIFGRK